MADTFKYAEMAEGTPDAAQEFLKEQLSKNRYTKEQVDRLDATGGPTVGAGGEGVVGKGPLYDAQNPTKGQSSAGGGGSQGIDGYQLKYKDQIKKYGSLSDMGFSDEQITTIRNHAKGLKTDGDYSKYAREYGFTADTENNFRELDDPTKEGSVQADMRKIANKLGFEHSGEANWRRIKDYIMEGEGKKGPTVKEEPNKPIEYSPEIQQAVNRVRSYENDILSGKTSQEIYGNNNNEENDNKYAFDMNKGIDGIGTEGGIIDSDTAAKSTENFLQSKKSDVMKKYQFKAA